ncbi:NADH-quinone oxidoreductase subunit C [candidate division KSB1 bacterium]|nr:NADH-quinone oxidoreductase subunit C [candidate division KSB1 bacterium]NIR72873.1 NADH-quinone oxidoreductase subunit C [candidate division KSB1 bacterium]NIS25150.1 NADH-quinone oxidoreductase subunit C [candidate division KSB1 bacterium]NIT72061.1 NADH-quinone oxidoreductase subunit C [candidate division KSB1 bacterium]NIU25852.1 NADH-quinone oxidoreductase subunit C [candidate division KSB1 bacterium]
MTPKEIYQKLQQKFGEDVLEFNGEALDPYIKINPKRTYEIAKFLKEEPDLDLSSLMCLSGMDYGADTDLGVVYNLHSMKHKHKITIRVDLPRDNPRISSVETIWRTADWHEREAYDLVGIHFEGHHDLRRILCPDDWEGYPLRKDYVVQEYYHGIRVPYQEDWGKYETFERNPERGHFVFKFESRVPHLVPSDGEDGKQDTNDKDDKKPKE